RFCRCSSRCTAQLGLQRAETRTWRGSSSGTARSGLHRAPPPVRRRGVVAGRVSKSGEVRWYPGSMASMKEITRVQTGVRVESRLLKVLKALATELDLSLGDLLEGIVLHAFEGKAPFSAATLKKIRALKAVYGLDLEARDSHRLREVAGDAR